MDEDVADMKWPASVAIVAFCAICIATPAGAEQISTQVAEPAVRGSVSTSQGVEGIGDSATSFVDINNAKNAPPNAQTEQAQLARDGQSPVPPSVRYDRTSVPPGSLTNQPPGSPATGTADNDALNLNREMKEAVRPLYEDLKSAGLIDAVRTLKSDLGLNNSSSSEPRNLSDVQRNSGSNLPQEQQRSAAQIERDKLIAAAMWDEFVGELKPWLYGLAGLFVLGYAIKLGFSYLEWKAMRSIRHSSKTRKHHRHHREVKGQDGARS